MSKDRKIIKPLKSISSSDNPESKISQPSSLAPGKPKTIAPNPELRIKHPKRKPGSKASTLQMMSSLSEPNINSKNLPLETQKKRSSFIGSLPSIDEAITGKASTPTTVALTNKPKINAPPLRAMNAIRLNPLPQTIKYFISEDERKDAKFSDREATILHKNGIPPAAATALRQVSSVVLSSLRGNDSDKPTTTQRFRRRSSLKSGDIQAKCCNGGPTRDHVCVDEAYSKFEKNEKDELEPRKKKFR